MPGTDFSRIMKILNTARNLVFCETKIMPSTKASAIPFFDLRFRRT